MRLHHALVHCTAVAAFNIAECRAGAPSAHIQNLQGKTDEPGSHLLSPLIPATPLTPAAAAATSTSSSCCLLANAPTYNSVHQQHRSALSKQQSGRCTPLCLAPCWTTLKHQQTMALWQQCIEPTLMMSGTSGPRAVTSAADSSDT